MEFLQYVLALIVTLSILVSVHELGHFVIARWSGVKVTRFSIGFGRPLWSRVDRHGTEFVLAAFPLGGYVRMLDEREGEVAPEDVDRSFNRLSPLWRIAIALGGPIANFLLAIFVYWVVFIVGTTQLIPVLGEVPVTSPAYQSGLRGGEEVVAVDGSETPSWPQITMALAARLGDSGAIRLTTRIPGESHIKHSEVAISDWQRGMDEPDLLGSLGLVPSLPATLGQVLPDSPAERAGLKAWDRVEQVDETIIHNWGEWVDVVRAAPDEVLSVTVRRGEARVDLRLVPGAQVTQDGVRYGFVGVMSITREIRYGVLEAVPRSLVETWSKTLLTLELLKKMVTGMVSTKNLAGPITIAKVAGDSARAGFESFFSVLALLSISLGVLNLLPIPILDGGHILYCVVELLIRRPVPARIQALGVQVGLFLVGGLMLLAFYNDITRLF
jgi:regulator of sigma E protease